MKSVGIPIVWFGLIFAGFNAFAFLSSGLAHKILGHIGKALSLTVVPLTLGLSIKHTYGLHRSPLRLSTDTRSAICEGLWWTGNLRLYKQTGMSGQASYCKQHKKPAWQGYIYGGGALRWLSC
ncbi:MAG: hypothetical protein ACUVWP_06670 [bacterium]